MADKDKMSSRPEGQTYLKKESCCIDHPDPPLVTHNCLDHQHMATRQMKDIRTLNTTKSDCIRMGPVTLKRSCRIKMEQILRKLLVKQAGHLCPTRHREDRTHKKN